MHLRICRIVKPLCLVKLVRFVKFVNVVKFVEVVKLGQDERTDVIAKMLSGSTITEEAKSQAQRLLEDALG